MKKLQKEDFKKYAAEFIGTLVLVVFGCGSAVAANTLLGSQSGVSVPLAFSTLLIAFAFGLVIVAMAYSVGNISGCHINPAVSLAMFASGKMTALDFIFYVIAQFAGATAGAALLWAMVGSNESLGVNGYGTNSALGADVLQAVLVEIVLTFVFVFVILGVTSKKRFNSVSGLVIGFTLTLVHILGIPFTGTSVNPARSFGPAIFQRLNGEAVAWSQLWVFILAPALGALIAALVYRLLDTKPEKKNEE